jgi:transposase-like protein
VGRRDAAGVAAGHRAIYTAVEADAAFDALAAFASSGLGQQYPQAVKVWENAWDRFTRTAAWSLSRADTKAPIRARVISQLILGDGRGA